MRPMRATSYPGAMMEETLKATGDTGILPRQRGFTQQRVTFHSIQSSRTLLLLSQLRDADSRSVSGVENIRAFLMDSSMFYITGVDALPC